MESNTTEIREMVAGDYGALRALWEASGWPARVELVMFSSKTEA